MSIEIKPIKLELISGRIIILESNRSKTSLFEISSTPKLSLVRLHKESIFLPSIEFKLE
ncbi:MAG: hypothetical protein KC550_07855 [Nanoarchaeota archaeon]|nr:hypothetical protein [Nanoarchaeota archaeon]